MSSYDDWKCDAPDDSGAYCAKCGIDSDDEGGGRCYDCSESECEKCGRTLENRELNDDGVCKGCEQFSLEFHAPRTQISFHGPTAVHVTARSDGDTSWVDVSVGGVYIVFFERAREAMIEIAQGLLRAAGQKEVTTDATE